MPRGGPEGLCLGKSPRKTAALTGKAVALLSCLLTSSSVISVQHSSLSRGQKLSYRPGPGNKNRIMFMDPEIVPEEQSPNDDELNVAPPGTDTEVRQV